MTMRSKTTIILTSRENFVWRSMQEIIPSIEAVWKAAQKEGVHRVLCFNVDENPIEAYLPALLGADNIVLTCFTYKLCRVASMTRQKINPDARFFIYLHNQATIACWPLHVFGLGELLRTDDVFISSCSLDADTMKHSFVECRVEVIPFSLPEIGETWPLGLAQEAPSKAMKHIPLVYIGRLSAQKNLHVMIYSFSLLAKIHPNVRLHIYGSEDNLGSPNMGIESRGYAPYLRELYSTLKLDPYVTFHGHIPREVLYKELCGIKHIFVSASLHSDENFGMAAFRSLCMGNQAVLSRWGGHVDFARNFPGQILLADVLESRAGPFIDPRQYASRLTEAIADFHQTLAPGIPDAYRQNVISERLLKLTTESTNPGRKLEPTPIAKQIIGNREKYAKKPKNACKIFSSYSDPLAANFFMGYGMGASAGRHAGRLGGPDARAGSVCLPPWVDLEDKMIKVNDPRRGKYEFSWQEDADAPVCTQNVESRVHSLPRKLAKTLLAAGFAHD